MRTLLVCVSLLVLCCSPAPAVVCSIKLVSDSRPDFTDMESLVHSVTASYQTTDEKCKAMWRWLTRCRRQTPQAFLHGMPVHDPIMFYNDFGYSMCSDYAALNCAIWSQMGLPVRLWDITAHTVSECFYDGRWHMFDNSLSAYYTLCDGKTVAGVEDVGKANACAASGGKEEMGHAALYHCEAATSPNGFLSGCDTQRPLKEEGEYVFNPNRLKYRYYYNGFELGHLYLLSLRENETYTRYARPLGSTSDYCLPLQDGGSPQDLGTFGNGEWVYRPNLTRGTTRDDVYEANNVMFSKEGLRPRDASRPGSAVFHINGANLITSARANFEYELQSQGDSFGLSYSVDGGLDYHRSAWSLKKEGELGVRSGEIGLLQAAGRHDYLVKLTLKGKAVLKSIEFHTITQLNKLTLPVLTLGRNTIDVVAGQPLDAIMVWPELQNSAFKNGPEACDSSGNMASGPAEEWHGCLWLEKPGTGYLTYVVQAPQEMAELTYGGRFYNRAPGSSITMEYSTDEGKTWQGKWTLANTDPPWDAVHFETARLPAGVKRALVRYTLHSAVAGAYEGCSIYSVRMMGTYRYSVRMMGTYRPPRSSFEPLEVSYNWSELRGDKWVERSHTQLIAKPEQRYFISVGGEDIPRTNWIRMNLKGAVADVKYGYSDGIDLRAPPLVRTRHIWAQNLAAGQKYTFSVPSGTNWEGGDPDMAKLTDGAVASTYGGGTTYRWGPIWEPGKNPAITLDLGRPESVAAVRIHVTGYPYDLYNGPFCTIEVLTSEDGRSYQSQGSFQTKMRAVDLDGDFLNQERGGFESLVFPFIFRQPAKARYVEFRVGNPEMFFDTSEIMVYDAVRTEEWREPLAMPLDAPR